MASIPDNIKKILYKFIDQLNHNGFAIDRAYLFGSYAKGCYKKHSDIDVALVSTKFQGNRFFDKKAISPIVVDVCPDLEVLPYNTKDFTYEDPFVKEIIDTGIEIK